MDEKRSLSTEELEILGMLNREFPADEPKTRMGTLLPEDCVVERIDNRWELITQTPSLPWGEYEKAVTHKRHRKRVFGALSKLANKYDWDEWTLAVVRIMTVAFTIAGYGALIPVYIIASIFLPNDG